MKRHSIQRAWLLTAVMGFAASGMSGNCAWAQNADADDNALSSGSVIPEGVGDLPGTAIARGNESELVTIGRPEDKKRMFLLYNVGTGKFLSVGGYWGTHAALSTVPRPFWLQHRSETRVKGANSYMRYPENADEYKGVFAYDFFSLTKMQVGNIEGSRRAHATYKYLRYVDSAGVAHNIIADNTKKDGDSFLEEIPVDFHSAKYKIEAQIDMGACTATQSGSGNMETLLSFGPDVSTWDYGICDLHIYGYRMRDSCCICVQPVDRTYKDDTHMFGNDKHPIIIGKDNLVTIEISDLSVKVNGKDCMPTNTYANSTNHIPVVHYYPKRAGQKVLFETDKNGDFIIGENNRYIITTDPSKGKPDKVDNTFLYSGDDLEPDEVDKPLPFFLTSSFVKGKTSYSNEGSYMEWRPYDRDATSYGTVGVFGDRALPYSDTISVETILNNSRWFFEPVGDSTQNIYRMYLEAKDQISIDKPGAGRTQHEGLVKFYLQATEDYVYGNGNEPYTQTPVIHDHTNVEAVEGLPDGDEEKEAWWKVISIEDYYTLFQNPSSEFTSMLDLSFMLSDPNFVAENGKLADWRMDDGLKGHVRIGYDQFSKKLVTDTVYTDDEGNPGSELCKAMLRRKINHGRYMGVDVRDAGTGKFYQEVTVDKAGWYAISCGGMSNAGAKLFIQMLDKSGNPSAPAERALYALTAEEKKWYENPADKGWPYDRINDSTGMPLYNALVAINDDNAVNGYQSNGNPVTDRYDTQVSFWVDPNVLNTNGGTLTLRFGIDVPAVATQASEGNETGSAPVATDQRWTVFDDFHLSFGGYSLEPNLILDEDSTNLDYIDRANHVFALRPMRLKRTFTPGVWNTLMLPVNLSSSDFHTLFGADAQLAQLDHLTATTVEFESVKAEGDSSVFLKAFKPYIIKVSEEYKKNLMNEDYTVRLANRENGGKTLYEVSIKAPYFYLETATLAGAKEAVSGQPYYDFKSENYVYKDNVLAVDESGTNTPLRAYGTLCKNFEGTTIITGRPDLQGAYVMSGGNMRLLKGQYGTKGFRCWFVPESTEGQQADINGVKVVIDGTDTGTGIADLVQADGGIYLGGYADGVYTLGGQLLRRGTSLEGLSAGIYIVNGMKCLVR